MDEKRKHPRIDRNISLKIFGHDFDIVTETKNISASGVYCAINKPLEEMTKLNIVLLLPLKTARKKIIKKIECTGIVIRKDAIKSNSSHLYNVGIYFSDLSAHNRKVLINYINTLRQENQIIPKNSN
jgi:hypothetical protein